MDYVSENELAELFGVGDVAIKTITHKCNINSW
ncbi:type A2 lantipeptide [Paraclostridium sp. AKS46]|nr:type A2 lantipeptide [Paraclostridium sp. AKS46]